MIDKITTISNCNKKIDFCDIVWSLWLEANLCRQVFILGYIWTGVTLTSLTLSIFEPVLCENLNFQHHMSLIVFNGGYSFWWYLWNSCQSHWHLYIWHLKMKSDFLPKSLLNDKKRENMILVGNCLNPIFFHIVSRCQTFIWISIGIYIVFSQ